MKFTITNAAKLTLAIALASNSSLIAQEADPIVEAGSGFTINPDNPTQPQPPVDGTPGQATPESQQTSPQRTSPQQTPQTTTANRPVGSSQQGAQFGQSFSLSRMMGVGIQGSDGKTLGSVRDVIFDSTGQIRYLAASRNLDGQSGQQVLIPRQAFDLSQPLQVNSDGSGFTMSANLNQQQFEQAPSFMEQQLTATSGPTPLFSQVDQYYGIDENTLQGGMNNMNRMNAMTRHGMPQNMNGQRMNANGQRLDANGQPINANGQQNLSGNTSSALNNRNPRSNGALQNRANQSANAQNPAKQNLQGQMNRNRGQVGAQGNIGARGSQGANAANPGLQNQINNSGNRGSGASPTNGVNVPGASTPGTNLGNLPNGGRPIDVGGGATAIPSTSGGASGAGGNAPAGGGAAAGNAGAGGSTGAGAGGSN